MRTLVDLRNSQVQALDQLAKRRDLSRAALIREAVDAFLSHHASITEDEAFGAWAGHGEDGLAFQERARREW